MEQVLLSGSIAEIGDLIATRKLSVRDVVAWYLDRIDRFNRSGPALNAVRVIASDALQVAEALDAELASGRRRGPLHGIPVLLKDNILTGCGMSAAGGAAVFADFIPARDATLVARFRQAGAVILGKANLTEFADYVSDVMPSGFSGAGGMVKNPHGGQDYGRGLGSSVGPAAAGRIALRVCDRQRNPEFDSDAFKRVFGVRLQADGRPGEQGRHVSAGSKSGLTGTDCAFDRGYRFGDACHRRRGSA
jgi:Asp-tRNA(Asn)/Glu-tRNA(Gln) amidotransferase A subunit family amidase